MLANVEERFWSKVEKTPTCWIWKGTTTTWGYGQFAVTHFDKVSAHRMSYELLRGSIPERLELDHLCRNKACVNPTHLEAVTHKENLLRGDTFQARNAKKTHCPRGHLLEYRKGRYSNFRYCRICTKESNRQGKLRRKAKVIT